VFGKLPKGDSGKALSDFTNSGSVTACAQKAMAYLVGAGVIGGNNGRLLPGTATTCVQMAQVLCSII